MTALSKEQRAAVREVARRLDGGANEVTLGGLAGTGKTTIARELPAQLGLAPEEVAYCAYTGKAASVLSRRLDGTKATTIHRLIYLPHDVHCSSCPRQDDEDARCHSSRCNGCYVEYTRTDVLDGEPRLIVVDEASMVSETIYEDLLSYGVPVVWIGDHGQLPPVGGSFNLMNDPDLRLETIHRQVAGSPILKLAMLARRTGSVPFGCHGEGVVKRRYDGEFEIDDVDDWSSDLLVLCGRNRTRVGLNRTVREARGFVSSEPVTGDRVICLRNNYDSGITNGTTGTVVACKRGNVAYRLTVALDGEDREWSGIASVEQFNHETTLSELPRRRVDLWDFGYALTVHKAQGSEADRVILFEERLGGDPGRHRRWLYTGITRAKRSLEILR